MTNFKSGSGNLDFGSGEDERADSAGETAEADAQRTDEADSQSPGKTTSTASDAAPADTVKRSDSDQTTGSESATSEAEPSAYPYFIRRNNVGDERDTRLEIHVRDEVADREAKYRNELAEQLGVNEVSKTDAREFALLAAYQDPESVAELMREEGFGRI